MPKVIRLALTPVDREELGRRRRARTIERRKHERLRIAQPVGNGATIPEAARVLGRHEQTVRKFVVRFTAESFAGLADRPRPGRPVNPVAAIAQAAANGACPHSLPSGQSRLTAYPKQSSPLS
jgi:hypothetical protein